MCNRSARMRDCPALTASDVVLGPFIFNYIANFVRLQRKGGSYTVESIERTLLSGSPFESVAGIDSEDLQDTLPALRSSKSSDTEFAPNLLTERAQESSNDGIDIEILKQEEEKYKNALQRLFDLYLFDSTAISQKDYMLKKDELEGKLQEVHAAIERNITESGSFTNAPDISFIKKASAFIVSHRMVSKKEINYEELATKCDNEILKELVNSAISKIGIRRGRVEYIEFQSGLKHCFVYKD